MKVAYEVRTIGNGCVVRNAITTDDGHTIQGVEVYFKDLKRAASHARTFIQEAEEKAEAFDIHFERAGATDEQDDRGS